VGYVPLGGDGYTAPFAAYTVDLMEDVGDGSGGTATLTVTMDPRFCALVQYATWDIAQATPAAAEFRVRLGALQQKVPIQTDQGTQANISATVSSSREVTRVWEPVPVVLPGGEGPAPFLEGKWANVDTDVYRLSIQIFLFNIRVREVTPMGPILWARGST